MSKSKAFCVSCKAMKDVIGPHIVTSKNGRKMLKGHCKCGQKVNKFIKG